MSKIVASCKDTGSIHFTNAELCTKLCAGKSFVQTRPQGMTLKVKGVVVKKNKDGAVVSEKEEEILFQDVYTCAGGKKSPGVITFFPAMAGRGVWKEGATYEIEISWAE